MFKKKQEPEAEIKAPMPPTFATQLHGKLLELEDEKRRLETQLQLIDERIAELDANIAWLNRNPRLESVLRSVTERLSLRIPS